MDARNHQTFGELILENYVILLKNFPACFISVLLQAESELTFYPSSGELRPLESGSVDVQFQPTSCRSVSTFIELLVEDGNER